MPFEMKTADRLQAKQGFGWNDVGSSAGQIEAGLAGTSLPCRGCPVSCGFGMITTKGTPTAGRDRRGADPE